MAKDRIILDSNSIWHNRDDSLGRVFNSQLADLRSFLDEHGLDGVALLIPKIVIEERITQNVDIVREKLKKMREVKKNLEVFKYKMTVPRFNESSLRKALQKDADKVLKQNNVIVLNYPKIDGQLVERAVKRRKPFAESDKGFKDTLIWLSLLTDAKKHEDDSYTLCTENKKDFEDKDLLKEYKKVNKGGLNILEEITTVKEYLDTKYVLKLELKALHREVEEGVKRNIGDIILRINSYVKGVRASRYSPTSEFFASNIEKSLSYGVTTGIGVSRKESDTEEIAYKLFDSTGNVDFLNIKKLNKNLFEVKLQVAVQPLYLEENRGGYGGTETTADSMYPLATMNMGLEVYPYSHRRKSVVYFTVDLNYYKNEDRLDVLSISRNF